MLKSQKNNKSNFMSKNDLLPYFSFWIELLPKAKNVKVEWKLASVEHFANQSRIRSTHVFYVNINGVILALTWTNLCRHISSFSLVFSCVCEHKWLNHMYIGRLFCNLWSSLQECFRFLVIFVWFHSRSILTGPGIDIRDFSSIFASDWFCHFYVLEYCNPTWWVS